MYKKFLNRNNFNNLKINIFLSLINTILETISIATLPLLLGLLINTNLNLEKYIPFNSNIFDKFYNLNNTDKILIAIIFITIIFIIKICFTFLVIYRENKMTVDISLDISRNFFNHYINSSYLHISKKKVSEILRNIGTETGRIGNWFKNYFIVFRECLMIIFLSIML